MPRRGDDQPTTADLVVLSLLCERPMHGYELNQVLRGRDVEDWAAVSRAQVYYSLRKALSRGWVSPEPTAAPSAGPERQVVTTTTAGRQVLALALEEPRWATSRTIPPFLTWMALSHRASGEAVAQALLRRRRFLEGELERERATLAEFDAVEGEGGIAASLMVTLTIRHFEVELAWLDEVEARLLPR